MILQPQRLDSSKPYVYHTYIVTFTDIKWVTGKDPVGDGYSLETIALLPNTDTYKVRAPDEKTAKEWAMDDLSQDWGFLVQGCKMEVKNESNAD